jgi:hypothetical protein
MSNDNTRDAAEPSPASAGSQRHTFEAAVMNWISEATSLIQWRSDGGRKIMADACQRCWDAALQNGENNATTLTANERDAIEFAIRKSTRLRDGGKTRAALRGLLERLG